MLDLRHGPPIALLGMVGGFLTPALMASGEPTALMFFSYLFFVFAGLIIIIAQRGWWLLALPAVLAAFAWKKSEIFMTCFTKLRPYYNSSWNHIKRNFLAFYFQFWEIPYFKPFISSHIS